MSYFTFESVQMSFRIFRASKSSQRLNFENFGPISMHRSSWKSFGTPLKDPSLTDDFLQIFVLMLKLKIFRLFVDTDDVDIIKTFKIFEFQIKFYNLDKVGSS